MLRWAAGRSRPKKARLIGWLVGTLYGGLSGSTSPIKVQISQFMLVRGGPILSSLQNRLSSLLLKILPVCLVLSSCAASAVW